MLWFFHVLATLWTAGTVLANRKLVELTYEKGGFRGDGLPLGETLDPPFVNPQWAKRAKRRTATRASQPESERHAWGSNEVCTDSILSRNARLTAAPVFPGVRSHIAAVAERLLSSAYLPFTACSRRLGVREELKRNSVGFTVRKRDEPAGEVTVCTTLEESGLSCCQGSADLHHREPVLTLPN